MKTNLNSTAIKAVMILAGLLAAAGSTGCDEMWVDGIGYVNPWYTSAYYGVPSATYYHPTAEIQSVIDYRSDAMETAAQGWDDYIMQ